jgi:hypothetical protein
MTIVDHDAPGAVYVLKNTITKRVYVGSSARPRDRRLSHMTELLRGKHSNKSLQFDFNLHGPSTFLWKQLLASHRIDVLRHMERCLMWHLHQQEDLYNSQIPRTLPYRSSEYQHVADYLFAYQTYGYEPAFEIQRFTPWCTPRRAVA